MGNRVRAVMRQLLLAPACLTSGFARRAKGGADQKQTRQHHARGTVFESSNFAEILWVIAPTRGNSESMAVVKIDRDAPLGRIVRRRYEFAEA